MGAGAGAALRRRAHHRELRSEVTALEEAPERARRQEQVDITRAAISRGLHACELECTDAYEGLCRANSARLLSECLCTGDELRRVQECARFRGCGPDSAEGIRRWWEDLCSKPVPSTTSQTPTPTASASGRNMCSSSSLDAGNILIGVAIGFSCAILVGTGLWCWTRRKKARAFRARHGAPDKIGRTRALEEGRHPRYAGRHLPHNISNYNSTIVEKAGDPRRKQRKPRPPPIPWLEIIPPTASTRTPAGSILPRMNTSSLMPPRPVPNVPGRGSSGTPTVTPSPLAAAPGKPTLFPSPVPPLQIKKVRGAHRVTLGHFTIPKSTRAIFQNVRDSLLRNRYSEVTDGADPRNRNSLWQKKRRSRAATLQVTIPQTPFDVPLPPGWRTPVATVSEGRRTPGTAPLERRRSMTARFSSTTGPATAPLMRVSEETPDRNLDFGFEPVPDTSDAKDSDDSDDDASSILTASTTGVASTILSTTLSSSGPRMSVQTSGGSSCGRSHARVSSVYDTFTPTGSLPPIPDRVLTQLEQLPTAEELASASDPFGDAETDPEREVRSEPRPEPRMGPD